ncbi:N-methyl-L-tryptophan oxidase [Nocardioides ginsengisoli]|uniref:N-methyl-L-tryptophan oxidase n=1 Tax=Nocardioides ginsengisoli TaxID=363868 RepID=A0ABW3W7G7_9ACTN
MSDYDVIVLGLGAMGSAASYQLARRGHRVLGFDAHPERHQLGSSHGDHRMIRRSHNDPDFRPYVDRAFELWCELEADSGEDLLSLYGEIAIQPASVLDEWPESERDRMPRVLSAADLAAEFPGFRVPEPLVATYEAESGMLRPEAAVSAQLRLARAHGAELRRPERVLDWTADGSGVKVTTDRGVVRAERLVVTAGPWAPMLLGELGLPIEAVRIVNMYVAPGDPVLWARENGAPNFMLDVPEGTFYGLPAMDGLGLKIGMDDTTRPTTPDTIDREVTDADLAPLLGALSSYLPGAVGPVTQTVTCMYTMTPDWSFIIERHREHPQIAYATGFSGMGFKFSPVVGEVLADLAVAEAPALDLSCFSSARFAGE